MSELNPMSGETLDITKENIEKLKELFPEVLTEDQVDFEKLRLILGDEVNDNLEKYSFTWNGKQNAIKLAQQPSTGTLRPNKEKSKNWNTTENLYIEGDNLEALKILQKSYAGKINFIYIDPPYNTGNDFVYTDNFSNSIDNYFEQTGQVDSEGNKFSTNADSSGRFHTDWLNMIYPRLLLGKNLLSDDGFIFISIGANEVANLEKICKEIFGENNYIATLTRIAKRTSNKGTFFKPTKDYILVISKYVNKVTGKFGVPPEIDESDYKYEDEKGKYKQNGASLYQPSLDSRPNQRYWIECPDGSFVIPPGNVFPEKVKDAEKVVPQSNNDKVWRWSVDTYLEKKDRLMFTPGSSTNPLINENGEQAKWNIYDKVYLNEKAEQTLLPEDVIYEFPNSQGTKELKKLNIPFSFSKPSALIKYLIKLTQLENDITVLDFFSGSSTTADAVMQLNAEDSGNRKFIMVQLPEKIDNKDEAYQNGYRDISEIGQERIRISGESILNEYDGNPKKFDNGFKVFELDKSNIQKWNMDSENLEESLFAMENNFVDGRSHADIVYEVLLKLGLDLNTPFEENAVDGSTVYDVAFGNLYVVLGENITQEVANYIADKQQDYENENPSVVFNDNGFIDDNEKLNTIEILKNNGFNEEQLMSI